MSNPVRWNYRPEGSNWGDFGSEDQIGRLNLISPQKVLEGIAEVREGRTFCLSLPLDYPGGSVLNRRRSPPRLAPASRDGRPTLNFPLSLENSSFTDIVSDDLVLMYLQYSTQWDGLCHIGSHFDADGDGVAERVYYNGFRAGEDVQGQDDNEALEGQSHAYRLGIEHYATHGIQGRGVMIDLEFHLGNGYQLVNYEVLAGILERDKVTVEQGDILCLHTGLAQRLLEMKKDPQPDTMTTYGAVLDGRDKRLLQWVSESGIAAIAADNYGVEAYPARAGGDCCAALPLHEHCLFKLGLPLGELWHLTPLARYLRDQGRSRFLLTAPPLRLPGAVGSPVTPIATV
jgi:kynurenine formamidase